MEVSAQRVPGYIFAAIQPSLVLTFPNRMVEDRPASEFLEKLHAMLDLLGSPEVDGSVSCAAATADERIMFATAVDRIKSWGGDERFTKITCFQSDAGFSVALPTLSPNLCVYISRVVLRLVENRQLPIDPQKMSELLSTVRLKAKEFLPVGTNPTSFIQSAADVNLPWYVLDRKTIIFGYGRNSRLFSSSMTDNDSANGVRVAKDKVATNKLLRLAGVPVADQRVIRTAEDALEFCERQGFPVVIKPSNQDQGRGVHAFLTSKNEVENIANEAVKAFSNNIIEKHYPGDGYRVYVLAGKVVRVRKLTCAHVIGDGSKTVGELVDAENANPLRDAVGSSMKKIVVDEEVERILAKQSLDCSSVPPKGTRVILSTTSNLSRGGTSEDFFAALHPENARLCEKVSHILGLHCSGIDLISKDASRPWHENGAIICEVNAQPQIGFGGRVDMHDMMIDSVNLEPVPIRLRVIARGPGRISLFDKTADSLEIAISAERLCQGGSPVQYYDDLIIEDGVERRYRAEIDNKVFSVRPTTRR